MVDVNVISSSRLNTREFPVPSLKLFNEFDEIGGEISIKKQRTLACVDGELK